MNRDRLWRRGLVVIVLLALIGLGVSPADAALPMVGNGSTSRVAVDASGNICVVGTSDAAWGTNPARAYNAGYDAHLVKMSPSDGAVQMLTFVGGEGDDSGSGLAVDGSGNP